MSGLYCLISDLDCLISGLGSLVSGLDCFISGRDCLIYDLDCLIYGLDCRIRATGDARGAAAGHGCLEQFVGHSRRHAVSYLVWTV